jgi:hypothetical protein
MSYCETTKRALKDLIYECRCNERLQGKTEGSTEIVYYESRKRELKIRLMNESRCDLHASHTLCCSLLVFPSSQVKFICSRIKKRLKPSVKIVTPSHIFFLFGIGPVFWALGSLKKYRSADPQGSAQHMRSPLLEFARPPLASPMLVHLSCFSGWPALYCQTSPSTANTTRG